MLLSTPYTASVAFFPFLIGMWSGKALKRPDYEPSELKGLDMKRMRILAICTTIFILLVMYTLLALIVLLDDAVLPSASSYFFEHICLAFLLLLGGWFGKTMGHEAGPHPDRTLGHVFKALRYEAVGFICLCGLITISATRLAIMTVNKP